MLTNLALNETDYLTDIAAEHFKPQHANTKPKPKNDETSRKIWPVDFLEPFRTKAMLHSQAILYGNRSSCLGCYTDRYK
jgi:hypothetical protein